ncbi:hypothetical protein F4561_000113 [Lipingzhangella halophila]|uniref:DUF4229 domain-containing protein n=1 Tax=Lipingzhangella halophila TaxID=1783352 RepID=A0A7W7W0K1_9ACTN|nr:DUF4229 domain-containing protein [Lipingzhangella halophila]MBB4929293.1 hypothetical protein [Lipingzhangella halophila]
MRSVIAYTASRILIFAVAYGVLYVLGAPPGAVGLALAFLVSGLVSYILLSEQRDAISASIVTWRRRRQDIANRLAEGAAKEDYDGATESAAARAHSPDRGGAPEAGESDADTGDADEPGSAPPRHD